tara:strand:+ start:766 stop:1050 length:285 start_codon:yes stop_codon:yes gene_type:complete
MALTKASAIDKIVIRSPYNKLELRTKTLIVEDDTKILAVNYSIENIKCGTLDASDNLVDTDMSGYSTEIQGVASAVWTDAIKTAQKEYLIANKT